MELVAELPEETPRKMDFFEVLGKLGFGTERMLACVAEPFVWHKMAFTVLVKENRAEDCPLPPGSYRVTFEARREAERYLVRNPLIERSAVLQKYDSELPAPFKPGVGSVAKCSRSKRPKFAANPLRRIPDGYPCHCGSKVSFKKCCKDATATMIPIENFTQTKMWTDHYIANMDAYINQQMEAATAAPKAIEEKDSDEQKIQVNS